MLRLPSLAVGIAVLALGVLLASGPGVRLGLWPFNVGILLLSVAGLLGLVAVILAIAGWAIPRLRRAGRIKLMLPLVIGVAVLSVPLSGLVRARSVPPIHDISTDTVNPPEFRERPGYAGTEVAAQQRKAYPDIQALLLSVPLEAAFSRARVAAEAMGWEIVAADPKAGRIEAVASTFWFGFKDDVVVRIVPEGQGSRVYVRSKSRVGVSDVGTNARRIRAYLLRVQ